MGAWGVGYRVRWVWIAASNCCSGESPLLIDVKRSGIPHRTQSASPSVFQILPGGPGGPVRYLVFIWPQFRLSFRLRSSQYLQTLQSTSLLEFKPTMTTYKGHCHCGQVEWTVKLEDASHILWFVPFCPRSSLPRRSLMPNCSSHCDACKLLSGGESTLNTIALKSDLNITKGNVKAYTYQGDSGQSLTASVHLSLFPIPSKS